MRHRILTATIAELLLATASASADAAKMEWDTPEFGFFEIEPEGGGTASGLSVHVRADRLLKEADYQTIVPEFCDTYLPPYLDFASKLDGAPEVSVVRLQLEFYGPEIGETQTYVASAVNLPLKDGACDLGE